MTRRKKRTPETLAEELRQTMELTGWNAAADLVIDTTATRLAGADEAARLAIEGDLRAIWQTRFEPVMWG